MRSLQTELGQLGRRKRMEEQMQRIPVEQDAANEIPSTISVLESKEIVKMPEGAISNAVDPQSLRDADIVRGINPDSKFHWNQKAERIKRKEGKSKKKKKSKDKKSKKTKTTKSGSKLLHEYKAE